jgi:hypothetical protein
MTPFFLYLPLRVCTFTSMKTAGIIYNTIQQTLRKNRQGTLRVSEVQMAINIGISNFFEKQLRLFRVSGFIPAPLEPLVTTETISLSSGSASVPSDFAKEVTFYVREINGTPAEFLNISEFIDRQTSQILNPTRENPIGTIAAGNISVYPSDIDEIEFTYIKRPIEVDIATTVSGRMLEYDDSNTTDTDIRPEYAPNIIKEALMFLGIQEQNPGAVELGSTVNQ